MTNNSQILHEAIRTVLKEPEYYAFFGSQTGNHKALTMRWRIAKLITIADRTWPRYEAMCCCKWYLGEVDRMIGTLQASDRIKSGVKRYADFLHEMLQYYEDTNGTVDPTVFGGLVIQTGSVDWYVFGYMFSWPDSYPGSDIHVDFWSSPRVYIYNFTTAYL